MSVLRTHYPNHLLWNKQLDSRLFKITMQKKLSNKIRSDVPFMYTLSVEKLHDFSSVNYLWKCTLVWSGGGAEAAPPPPTWWFYVDWSERNFWLLFGPCPGNDDINIVSALFQTQNKAPLIWNQILRRGGGSQDPLFRGSLFTFWKSKIIVEAFENNVTKFEVVLVLYYFEEKHTANSNVFV